MKIMSKDNKLIVYLYNELLDIDNKELLYKEIKDLFIKLIKKYHYSFFGYWKVDIYHNEIYGSFLEMEKIYDGFSVDIIDLKIRVFKNTLMKLEFDDNYFINKRVKYKNGKYYLNIKNPKDLIKYIEYGKIIYYKNS